MFNRLFKRNKKYAVRTEEYRGVAYTINQKKFNKSNYAMAIACYSPKTNNLEIIVEEDFLNLSGAAKEFVLKHELGHYNCGHFNKGEHDLFEDEYKMEEIEADQWAFNNMDPTRAIEGSWELYLWFRNRYGYCGDSKELKFMKYRWERLCINNGVKLDTVN